MSTGDRPDRYSPGEWERSKRDVLAEREAQEPAPSPYPHRTSILVPGVVEMILRGKTNRDVERLVAGMRAAGFEVFPVPKRYLPKGARVGYRYFTVKVPPEAPGG